MDALLIISHSFKKLWAERERPFNHFFPPFQHLLRDCVSRHNGGTSGAVLKPLRDDSVLRALLSLRGLRGAPEVPPLCRETQSLGQHMFELGCENATVGKNGLMRCAPYFLVERALFFSGTRLIFSTFLSAFYFLLKEWRWPSRRVETRSVCEPPVVRLR